MARRQRPIGVFDSGVGGLSVLRHVRAMLPGEDLLYVADSAHDKRRLKAIERQIAQEADALLERDWLLQAGGDPLAERSAAEVAWTRRLAARLARAPGGPSLSEELAELDRLTQRAHPTARELYLAVRRVKRRIALRNPAIDFQRILCIDQPMPSGPNAMVIWTSGE